MDGSKVRELLRTIMTNYELTSDEEDQIHSVISEVDESEGMEHHDDTEDKARISELESQLKASKQKYIDRFFGGVEDGEDAKEKQKEDIEEHDNETEEEEGELKIEDLFEEVK